MKKIKSWLHPLTLTIVGAFLLASLTACGWLFNFAPFAESSAAQNTEFPNTDPEIQQIIDGYALWASVNLSPEYVLSESDVAGLCRLPTRLDESLAKSEHGGFWLNVYVNQIGLQAMQQGGSRQFPVGTVIVKAKLERPDATSPFALGMMIKRPAGSNPAGGDWEFLYQERTQPLARGTQLPNCQSCHSAQNETDSVFNVMQSANP